METVGNWAIRFPDGTAWAGKNGKVRLGIAVTADRSTPTLAAIRVVKYGITLSVFVLLLQDNASIEIEQLCDRSKSHSPFPSPELYVQTVQTARYQP